MVTLLTTKSPVFSLFDLTSLHFSPRWRFKRAYKIISRIVERFVNQFKPKKNATGHDNI